MPRRGFIPQAKTRWLLLGLAVLFSLMLFMYLLECAPPTDGNVSLPGLTGDGYGKEYYQALLQEQEEHYQGRATILKRQIAQLKQELQDMSEKLKLVQDKKAPGANGVGYLGVKEQAPSDLLEFLHSQIDKAEVGTGAKLPSEYSVVPFESFTSTKVFQLEMGLTRHPEEKPIRKDKRDELVEAIEAGLEVVNNPDEEDEEHDVEDVPVGDKLVYSESDFVEGYYRTEKDKGTQYELFYKKADRLEYKHVTLFRPFGPLMKVKSETLDTSKSLINIIVPLSGRTEIFTQFMQNFRDVCILQDKRIHLTVVYFGKEGLSAVRTILETVASKTSFRNYTLISLNEEFNRGRGLEVGARAWAKGEVLMFFCDVDVYFTAEFLQSCRLNSEPGKKVFYPVVFSLYNPAIVYASQEVPPPVEQQLVHKKDSGFWRDFGFGMTCQFRSDFLTIELTEDQKKLIEAVELLNEYNLQGFKNHTEAVKSLNRLRINDLVWSVQQVLDHLKELQKEAYKTVKPQDCPVPEAPKNGGLVCVSVNKINYCKPMCNQGYDFSFIRRSRLYEECGRHTASKWTTQFIGGSRLAECIASDIAISGVSSAYFPPDMKCQKTIANATMEDEQVSRFLQELRAKNIMENHDKTMDAIICGD